METKIFTNKSEMYCKAIELNIYSNSNFQHDFLATCVGTLFGMTDKYFFKHVDVNCYLE